MAVLRSDILNTLARAIRARRYLEIGVQGGDTFLAVDVAEKVGVDPDLSSVATVHKTSSEYFADLDPEERFDLVFVDGLHHQEAVREDIYNALPHLTPRGAIVVHDCDPPYEEAGLRERCARTWCGDTWQGWLDVRRTLQLTPRARPLGCYTATVDTDLGCGLVLPFLPPRPGPLLFMPPTRTWKEFQANRAAWLGLISVDQFTRLVRGLG